MRRRLCRDRLFAVMTASLLIAVVLAPGASAQDRFHLNGFAWARGSAGGDDPILETEDFSLQLQAGLDWYFTPRVRAHLQVLARDDRDGSSEEKIGIVEGYVDAQIPLERDRLRLRAGAFFLPTSREHVDELWATPYSITPSALNGWFGEELRPIGLDLEYHQRLRNLTLGGTLFVGNDAFGALPARRGWRLRNHIALVNEEMTVFGALPGAPSAGKAPIPRPRDKGEYISEISVDTDDRPGWSARARWSSPTSLLQYTYIDNRASGTGRRDVFPWRTPFHIVSVERTMGDWTFAAEGGWGPTWIPGFRDSTLADLRASYLMVSRRLGEARATLRLNDMAVDRNDELALTAAWLWSPFPRTRAAVEVSGTDDDVRAMVELRTHFSWR